MKDRRRVAVVIVAASVALGIAFASPAWARSDKQVARASTLRISDFPAGWTASPATEGSPSKLPPCRATVAAAKKAKPYRATSPDFGLSNGGTPTSQVANMVYVFPSVKQAKAYLAAFKLPTALECLQQSLDQKLESSPGASASIQGLDVTGGPVDDEVGFQGVISGPETAQAGVTDTYVQALAFRVGRAVTAFSTTNPGAAYPDTAQLVRTEVARLKKNLR